MSADISGAANLDNIFAEIGDLGIYQITSYILIFIPNVLSSSFVVSYMFAAKSLDYRWVNVEAKRCKFSQKFVVLPALFREIHVFATQLFSFSCFAWISVDHGINDVASYIFRKFSQVSHVFRHFWRFFTFSRVFLHFADFPKTSRHSRHLTPQNLTRDSSPISASQCSQSGHIVQLKTSAAAPSNRHAYPWRRPAPHLCIHRTIHQQQYWTMSDSIKENICVYVCHVHHFRCMCSIQHSTQCHLMIAVCASIRFNEL